MTWIGLRQSTFVKSVLDGNDVPIVVDASAFVELLLRTPAGAQVEDLLRSEPAFAPELLDADVTSVLARLERRNKLDSRAAGRAVIALAHAPIERVAHRRLIRVAWSKRHSVSLYDAFYVALASHLACPLVTGDRKLAGASGLGIALTLVGVPA